MAPCYFIQYHCQEGFGMFENVYEFHTRIPRMKHIPRMPEEEGTQ